MNVQFETILSIIKQLLFLKKVIKLFKNDFIFASLSLSGNITAFSIWFIIKVIGLIGDIFIVLMNLVDMPSNPKLDLGANLSIINTVFSSFMF